MSNWRDYLIQIILLLTRKRYITSLKHTHSFIQWKYGVKDIEINRLDYEFITEYEFWLKSVRRCNHNSAMKYIRNFRMIINGCIRRGWLSRDPFFGFKMSLKEVERIPLSAEDLQALANKEFSCERLGQVKDIFLFCCFIGFAYVDIKKLKRS
ncbi:MAG: site-specific integrase [Ginsengibacter sp.]